MSVAAMITTVGRMVHRVGTLASRLTVTVVLIACLCGCGVTAGGSTKAGGASLPVTLRLGYFDAAGGVGGDRIEDFAAEVASITGGALRIEPVWSAAGTAGDDFDQVVARRVIRGDLDMAVVATRAWDTEGVTSLRALNAPELVTSDEALGRIVTSDLADRMLSGLDAVGVTGLGLLPVEMRHLFVFGDPLRTIANFEGRTIRSLRSDTVYSVLAALNAKPDDLANDNNRLAAGINDGSVRGAESSFSGALVLPLVPTAIANLTLFPKVEALVINSAAFKRLSGKEREQLQEAASQAVASAVANDVPDSVSAGIYCRNGGSMLLASANELDQVRGAFQSVYRSLERDGETKAIIAEIRALAADVPDPPTPSCDERPATAITTAATTTEAATSDSFPEGSYRMEISVETLMSAGIDLNNARQHAGTWTLTFHSGELTIADEGPGRPRSVDTGVYCVTAGRVSLGLNGRSDIGDRCGDFMSAAWTYSGDQFQFVDIRSKSGFDQLLTALFGSVPFSKIG